MRYKPQQQDENRRQIVQATGRGFRRYGYAGIGVDGLAKAAGVTSGAIYSQFGSKEKAFAAALEDGLGEIVRGIPALQSQHGRHWVEAFANYYLAQAHRADLPCGCAMATLTPDVVRTDTAEIRTIYEQRLQQITQLIAAGLEGGSDDDRTRRATTLISILIGGITLSRAVATAAAADAIAQTIIQAAVHAAGPTCQVPATLPDS